VHVQPDRVNHIHVAQGDWAAMGPNRDSSVHCARAQPLKPVTQACVRATLEVRTVLAAATSAVVSTPGADPAPIHAGELDVEDEEDHARRDNDLLNNPAVHYSPRMNCMPSGTRRIMIMLSLW
jgi:hypothetical protein